MSAGSPGRGVATARLVDGLLAEGRPIRFPVSGRSMRPLFRGGERVVVTPCGLAALRLGDLVLWRATEDGHAVLHRLVAVTQDGFQTRGDGLWAPDPVQPAAALLGRVTRIEGLAGYPCAVPVDHALARWAGRGVAALAAGARRARSLARRAGRRVSAG